MNESWAEIIGSLELILAIGGICCAVLAAVIKFRRRKPLLLTSAQEFRESYFSPPTTQRILDSFRTRELTHFSVALALIANSPVCEEEVITELAKIIGMLESYSNVYWLNYVRRCRACRLLHLAIERNRSDAEGLGVFGHGVDYEAILKGERTSYCVIMEARKGFVDYLSEVACAIIGILRRTNANKKQD